MKNSYFFLILMFSFQVKAQKNDFYNTLNKSHHFYTIKSLFLTDSLLPNSFANIYSEGFYGKNELKHPFMADNFYGINVSSEGGKKMKKYNIYGIIRFNERYDNGALGKNIFSTKYLSPYYLLDTLQKDWKHQKVMVKTIMSKNITARLNTEITAQYTAQHKVNYQYPKPLLYGNNFKIQPAIGYKINRNHKISLGYFYKNNNYEVTIDDGAVSQVKIFSVTGVGNLTNRKGFGSNYRYVSGKSNSIIFKGLSNFAKNNTLSYRLSLENTTQKGFDDSHKKQSVFDYNEWLTNVVTQLKIKHPKTEISIKYQLLYQSGKGTHLLPKNNDTFTEKTNQKLELLYYNTATKKHINLSVKHLHQREANSIYANFYDFDYLLFLGNYTKTLSVGNKEFCFSSSVGYQTPIYQKNRFVKKNPYINHFLLPFINFYDQDFFYIHFSHRSNFLLFKSDVQIGFNTQVALNISNKINLFNSLSIKTRF